jgi:hypothetical protein
MSMIVMFLIVVDAGVTTTTLPGRKPDQGCPWVPGVVLDTTGGFSGLPPAQRTRGMPRLSTRTAVPRWSTDWKLVARPSWKPWSVTCVSARSTTEVRARRKSGTVACRTPAACAKERALAGSEERKPICFSTSQLPTARVPP